MEEIIAGQHTGVVEKAFTVVAARNCLEVRITLAEIPAGKVGIWFLIEQTQDGIEYWPFGGADIYDVRAAVEGKDKQGNPITALTWRFYEQLVRPAKATEKAWPTTREYRVAGDTFKQLALCPYLRITCDSYVSDQKGEKTADAELKYSVEIQALDRAFPAEQLPITGRV